MRTVTATELARNFRAMLDSVEHRREELVILRNNHAVARIVPGPTAMTALEAMGDLYRTLPGEAGREWLADSRKADGLADDKVRDPWES
jgi:antitoxin (DNA-binding transcriptional repressor) of toxin-antitoxin stability system